MGCKGDDAVTTSSEFYKAFNEHRAHILDNIYAPITGGRYTLTVPEPKAVKGCRFCEHPELLEKLFEGVDEE